MFRIISFEIDRDGRQKITLNDNSVHANLASVCDHTGVKYKTAHARALKWGYTDERTLSDSTRKGSVKGTKYNKVKVKEVVAPVEKKPEESVLDKAACRKCRILLEKFNSRVRRFGVQKAMQLSMLDRTLNILGG